MVLKSMLLFVVLALTGCTENSDDRANKIQGFFEANRNENNPDYILMKSNSIATSTLGIMFGYFDNRAGCREIAMLLETRHPESEFFCEQMN